MDDVVLEVIWADRAKISFNNIVEYLREEWTDREVSNTIDQTSKKIATLKRYPEIGRPSAKKKNVRLAILNKHTQLIYPYKPGKERIEILLFWGMKQNPSKLKY